MIKTITTQKELDELKQVQKNDKVIIHSQYALNLAFDLDIYGFLQINSELNYNYHEIVARENSSVIAMGNSSVVAWENSSVEAMGNSSVVARGNSSVIAKGNSSVEAWENSSVEAMGNNSVVARGNSSVIAMGNSSVVAWENSSVEAMGNSSVVARGNSSVIAKGNSSVEAWENSSVIAKGNSSVEAWENSSIEAMGNNSVVARGSVSIRIPSHFFTGLIRLFGYSVVWFPTHLKINLKIESKTAKKIEYKEQNYLDREGIRVIKNKITLYKKVSSDFKTQENTYNETEWNIEDTVIHKEYDPTKEECGANKFHACSKPYFCDEFRNEKGDRYIAIEIDTEKKINKFPNFYEWKNSCYSHKCAFGEAIVLYECDKFGKKIN